jgi:hypothetical protein
MTNLTFDIYLRATPERVRAVLTDPGRVPSARFGVSFQSDWNPEPTAGRRLTCDWLQTDHVTANGGRPSVVSLVLTAMGEVTRLRLVHRFLTPGSSYLSAVAPGWPMLLSSLKSLVETGKPLEFGASG